MDRLLVVADDREQRSPVYKLLQSSEHFNLQTRRLPLGDYLIGETLLVERKTLPDLAV